MFKTITITTKIPHPQYEHLFVDVTLSVDVKKDYNSEIDLAIAEVEKMAKARFDKTQGQSVFAKAKLEQETAQKALNAAKK